MKTRTMMAVLAMLAVCQFATGGILYEFEDPATPGLSAEAEFTLLDSTTLQVRLKNTSTSIPAGFDSSDQLLTGISWDFGHPGYNGDALIISGSVVIGPSSETVNFDTGYYGSGSDVGGEYGYGNQDGTGALTNFFSGNSAQATVFGGANLDGSASIDGPQAGLLSAAASIPLGGNGAIRDEIIATLTLNEPLADLGFLEDNGVRVEFGSDAKFITIPEPATILLLTLGGIAAIRRRK